MTHTDEQRLDDEQCPACGARATTAGRFFGRVPFGFLPAGLRFWTLRTRPVPIPTAPAPRACTACGLLWVRVEAATLREILRMAGTDATRQRFSDGAA
jgi:hypothetical protein